MKRWIGRGKSISFRLKWIFMSSEERYAHLWARTKKLGYEVYAIRNAVGTNK